MFSDILMGLVFAFAHWIRSPQGSAEIDLLESEFHASQDVTAGDQGQGSPATSLGVSGNVGAPGVTGQADQQPATPMSATARKKQSSTVGMQP